MWLFTRGYPDFEASSYWGVHKGDHCSGIWQAERSHHGTLGHPVGSVWSVGHDDGSPEGRSESVKTWRVVLAYQDAIIFWGTDKSVWHWHVSRCFKMFQVDAPSMLIQSCPTMFVPVGGSQALLQPSIEGQPPGIRHLQKAYVVFYVSGNWRFLSFFPIPTSNLAQQS